MEEFCVEVDLGKDAGSEKAEPLIATIQELPMADGVHASTGCQLWPAGVEMARSLVRNPDVVLGRHVVELGAGCGLLGLAAARYAKRVLITDGDEEVVGLISRNLDLNQELWQRKEGSCEVSARTLRWEDLRQDSWPEQDRFDVVFAVEAIYGHWGDLVADPCLRLVAPGGLVILAASEDRRSGVPAFERRLAVCGFRITETVRRVPECTYHVYECLHDAVRAGSQPARTADS